MQEVPIRSEWFEGAVSLEAGDGWPRPWRLPFERRRLYDDVLVDRAGTSAGVRVRFRTDARRVGLAVVPLDAPRSFDLVVGNELIETALLKAGEETVRFERLAEGSKVVEVWLPQAHAVAVRTVLADRGAGVEAAPDRRRRWVTYGSSITHCGGAHSPARTWPAIAARRGNVHLTCLGFGGNCHLDPLVAAVIRDLPADMISLKVGVNIYGSASLSERTFWPNLAAFAQIIREKHPTTPLAVVSAIISPPRETTPNAVGLTLVKMRQQVRAAVERMRELGDGNVRYFDGLEVFGPELVDPCLPDGLHPNAEGYKAMGRSFVDKVARRYFQC